MHSEKRKSLWVGTHLFNRVWGLTLPGTSSPQGTVRKQMVTVFPSTKLKSHREDEWLLLLMNGSHANISKCCQEKKAWWGGGEWGCWLMGWSRAATPRKWHGDLRREWNESSKGPGKGRWRRHEPGLLDDWEEGAWSGRTESRREMWLGWFAGPWSTWGFPLSTIHQSKASGHFVCRGGHDQTPVSVRLLPEEWTRNWPEWRLGKLSRPGKALVSLSNGSGFLGS